MPVIQIPAGRCPRNWRSSNYLACLQAKYRIILEIEVCGECCVPQSSQFWSFDLSLFSCVCIQYQAAWNSFAYIFSVTVMSSFNYIVESDQYSFYLLVCKMKKKKITSDLWRVICIVEYKIQLCNLTSTVKKYMRMPNKLDKRMSISLL